MPRPRHPAPAPAIDARSDATVLVYAGGQVPRDVPARDLTGNDLDRIGYVRNAAAAEAAVPEHPDAATLAALADELVAGGAFVRVPAPPAEPEA